MLTNRVCEATKRKYASSVKMVIAEVGGLEYEQLVRFLRTKGGRASTKRGVIAGVNFWLDASGEKMEPGEKEDLNRILDGIEAIEGEEGKVKRGNADLEKVKEMAAEANRRGLTDIGDGLVLLHGVCGRPRDMGDLEWNRVDMGLGMVYLERKATKKKKGVYGKYEEHAVVTREGQRVLEKRWKACKGKDGLVFPGWRPELAREVVKATAMRLGWDKAMKWNGPHVVRHGAAGEVKRRLMSEAQVRGGWRSSAAVERYSLSENERKR